MLAGPPQAVLPGYCVLMDIFGWVCVMPVSYLSKVVFQSYLLYTDLIIGSGQGMCLIGINNVLPLGGRD